MKAVNREVQGVLAEGAPDLARRMVERALATDDDRTLAVIGLNVLDRVQGKPTEQPQSFDNRAAELDERYLSPEEMEKAVAACEYLTWCLAVVAERQAAIETHQDGCNHRDIPLARDIPEVDTI